MAVTTTLDARTTPSYPAVEVAAALRDGLVCAVRSRSRRRGVALPKADNELAILDVEIDSLTVVEMLAHLDDILPFKVTENVVRAGGYGSINAAVTHVVGGVKSKWKSFHEKGRS